MSLDKAIEHKKEKRKAYRGAKAVDVFCRNHGECMYCLRSRMYRYQKDKQKSDFSIKEYEAQQQELK